MSLSSHLQPGEVVLARAGPFFATSRRVLRYQQLRGGAEDLRELPYTRISSAEATRPPNHKFMAGGLAIASFGLLLSFTFGFVTSYLALPAGIAMIVMGGGGFGQPQYFQLHTAGATKKEQAVWRIPYAGSMNLMVEIQTRTERKR